MVPEAIFAAVKGFTQWQGELKSLRKTAIIHSGTTDKKIDKNVDRGALEVKEVTSRH